MSTGESYKNGRREGFKNGYIQGKFDGELKKSMREIKEKDLLNLYRKWFMAKTTEEQDNITNQIVKLEKELEK